MNIFLKKNFSIKAAYTQIFVFYKYVLLFFPFVSDHCGPPPIMASSIGRNSPLLELAGVSSNRSSSLGRNTSLIPMTSEAAHMRPKGAPPLLDDDRESCV